MNKAIRLQSLSSHRRWATVHVTSDIIGQLNRRVVIPLLPVEKYPSGTRPERLLPLIKLADNKGYVVMTHEMASIPSRSLGMVFCDASLYRTEIKAAIDFLFDGI